MKKLYCFDFDGTLTKKDTMFDFLKFYNRKSFYLVYVKYIPLFILLKLGLLPADKVKESFISEFLAKKPVNEIEEVAKRYMEVNFQRLIRPNALEFIQTIDLSQVKCFLVTASLEYWVRPFAERMNMKLLATEGEVVDGVFTGKFRSLNCNGIEKVRRIEEEIGENKYDKIIAFGDTKGDSEMLNFANESHFKFFH